MIYTDAFQTVVMVVGAVILMFIGGFCDKVECVCDGVVCVCVTGVCVCV